MKKRGQVTIFVLIALVLLFIIAGVYFVKEVFLEQRLFSEIQEPDSIPSQIRSVNLYVDNCIDTVALEGIGILGYQGGYIRIPEDPLPISVANPFSNHISLPGVNVPYWYYEDFSQKVINSFPTLEDIEHNLAQYMEENLANCISNFDLLEEGFNIDSGNVASEIDIKENDVYVKIRYPLDIKKEGVSYSLTDHVQSYPIKLGKMYEQAVSILKAENEQLWLENKSLDLIYLDDERVPGVVLDFSCSPLIYSEREIANDLKQSLAIDIPLYYVEGSKVEVSGEFESLALKTENVNKDLIVDFGYDPDWPMVLDVKPSNGDVILLEPFEGNVVFGSLCYNYEQLFYDIKYPVIVSITDETGYLFQYGFMVVIRGNEARGNINVLEDSTASYCEIREKNVPVYAEGVDSKGVVSPLPDADVFYQCVSNNCYIGRTDETGYLQGTFPICGNGEVNVKKEGYVDGISTLTTFDNGEESVSVSLESFVEKPFSVKVYDLVNGALVGPRELKNDEEAMFQISYDIKGNSVFGDVGIVPGEDMTIQLVPEVFHLKGNLLKTTPTYVEGESVTRCKGPEVLGVCTAGTETITIPGETIEQVVLGGVELDWKVRVDDLYSSSDVEIYLINKGVPTRLSELNTNFDVLSLTSGFESEVEPTFL